MYFCPSHFPGHIMHLILIEVFLCPNGGTNIKHVHLSPFESGQILRQIAEAHIAGGCEDSCGVESFMLADGRGPCEFYAISNPRWRAKDLARWDFVLGTRWTAHVCYKSEYTYR